MYLSGPFSFSDFPNIPDLTRVLIQEGFFHLTPRSHPILKCYLYQHIFEGLQNPHQTFKNS